jgi:predicted ATP-dependent serine protease
MPVAIRLGLLNVVGVTRAYIKVAGGVRLTEPAVDLSIIVATASSFKDKAVDGLDCYIGVL